MLSKQMVMAVFHKYLLTENIYLEVVGTPLLPGNSHGLQPSKLLCPWDSPGKRTGVGRQCLLG